MTVVAYKDGVLAADTAAWHGDVKTGFAATKLSRFPDGSIAGFAGWLPIIEVGRAWIEAGMPSAARPEKQESGDFSCILVRPDGLVINIGPNFLAYETGSPIDAVGSHTEFLYGAMAAGATAEQAVRLAIKHCSHAGGDVTIERIVGRAAQILPVDIRRLKPGAVNWTR